MSQLLQCFNNHFFWHQPKLSFVKRWAKLMNLQQGMQTYRGILNGLTMKLDLASEYERLVYFNAYEMVLIDVIRSVLKPGDVFVDGGANIGVLSLFAARLVGPKGQVYAFEPQPGVVERLQKNIQLNQLDNIQVFGQGCWHEKDDVVLYDYEDVGIVGQSLGYRPDRVVKEEINVTVDRIDAAVSSPVKLIKLDVEGAELSALKGSDKILTNENPPHLIVELKTITAHAFDYEPIEIIDWLLARGVKYQIFHLKTRSKAPIDYDALVQLLKEQSNKTHNVWLAPIES